MEAEYGRANTAMTRKCFFVAILTFLPLVLCPTEAQQAYNFVLKQSDPYVYLKFDHVGPRTPFVKGESNKGVWIKIVNNCRVPILIPTVGTANSNGEIQVLDEVVPLSRPIQFSVTDSTGNEISGSEPPQHAKLPIGYADHPNETPGLTPIAPGESLLFSVPINHVAGGDWYMRVRFSLDIPGSKHGPYSYADSFTIHIPSQYTK